MADKVACIVAERMEDRRIMSCVGRTAARLLQVGINCANGTVGTGIDKPASNGSGAVTVGLKKKAEDVVVTFGTRVTAGGVFI